MSVQSLDPTQLIRTAYDKAWGEFIRFPNLSPDEKLNGPKKLREYIKVLVDTGEQDAERIAVTALGLIREYEQIARSKAAVSRRSISSVAAE
jgi:hypothetical protein